MAFMRGRKVAVKESTKYNPDTANGVRRSHRYFGHATERHCGFCRDWYKTAEHGSCPKPECQEKLAAERPSQSVMITNPDSTITGWYEHIDPKGPIYIESRKQLYQECARRGLQAQALMSGGVMKRPRGA